MYFLCNKKCCTFLFSVPMGVLFLWETGGTSRILKRNYRCCIGGAVTWRLQRGTAAIKWALLSAPWRSVVEFCLNHVPSVVSTSPTMKSNFLWSFKMVSRLKQRINYDKNLKKNNDFWQVNLKRLCSSSISVQLFFNFEKCP